MYVCRCVFRELLSDCMYIEKKCKFTEATSPSHLPGKRCPLLKREGRTGRKVSSVYMVTGELGGTRFNRGGKRESSDPRADPTTTMA